MSDLFTNAKLGAESQKTPSAKKTVLISKLSLLLEKAPFLTDGEKNKMKTVIPLFNDTMIQELCETMIRENLRYLQNKALL